MSNQTETQPSTVCIACGHDRHPNNDDGQGYHFRCPDSPMDNFLARPLRPTINLNGASRDAHVERAKAIAWTLQRLAYDMRRAFPHGRDYQLTSAEAYQEDREIAIARVRAIEDLGAAFQADALHAMDYTPKDRTIFPGMMADPFREVLSAVDD
jgi:hypothetical protein